MICFIEELLSQSFNKYFFGKKEKCIFSEVFTSAGKDHSTRPNLSHVATLAYPLIVAA